MSKDGEDVKLVKLRNPWGSFEWKGDWSEESELWTEEIKAQLNFEKADDGMFWMSFDDFKQYFDRVQICEYRDSYDLESLHLPVI